MFELVWAFKMYDFVWARKMLDLVWTLRLFDLVWDMMPDMMHITKGSLDYVVCVLHVACIAHY